jgi:hypothetical protein
MAKIAEQIVRERRTINVRIQDHDDGIVLFGLTFSYGGFTADADETGGSVPPTTKRHLTESWPTCRSNRSHRV